MPPRIDIKLRHDYTVGHITFDEGPRSLKATRIARGVRIGLPITVELRRDEHDRLLAMLDDLRGTVSVPGPDGSMEVGSLSCDQAFEYGNPRSEAKGLMEWEMTPAELRFVEGMRNGKKPAFRVDLRGKVYAILPYYRDAGKGKVLNLARDPFYRTTALPETLRGNCDLVLPHDVWVQALDEVGLADAIILETPILPQPPKGWGEVWKAWEDARQAFMKGGSTGWKDCAASVRLALEEWDKIDPLSGRFPLKAGEVLKDRSKEERVAALRWSLHHLAHLGPHKGSDQWNRDEALLVLSTLSALLSARGGAGPA